MAATATRKSNKSAKPAKKPAAQKKAPAAPAPDPEDLTLDETPVETPGAAPGTDPEDAPSEPAQGEEEPEAPAPPAKGKPAAAPAEPAPAADGGMDVDPAAGYETMEIPVGQLQPNKLRTPTPEQVDRMVRSIRQVGRLLDPIVITTDGFVVAGNKRLAAYIILKKKTIPARYSIDAAGNPLTMKEAEAQLQAMASNIQRDDMTPLETGRAYAASIKRGLVADAAELAKRLGVAASEVSRVLSVYEKGSDQLKKDLAAGDISFSAAFNLVSKAKLASEQDAILENIKAASNGKVPLSAVRKASGGTRNSKRGAKPAISELSAEVLKSETTGVLMQIRKVGRGQYRIDVRVVLEAEASHLARFDVQKKVQTAMAKLDMSEVRKELELARQRVDD